MCDGFQPKSDGLQPHRLIALNGFCAPACAPTLQAKSPNSLEELGSKLLGIAHSESDAKSKPLSSESRELHATYCGVMNINYSIAFHLKESAQQDNSSSGASKLPLCNI